MLSDKERKYLLALKEKKKLAEFSKGYQRFLRCKFRMQVREARDEIRQFIDDISLLQWFADYEDIKIGPRGTYSNLPKMLAAHAIERVPNMEQFIKKQSKHIKFGRLRMDYEVQRMNALIAHAQHSVAPVVVLTAGLRAMNKQIAETRTRYVKWIKKYRGRLLLYKLAKERKSKTINETEISDFLTSRMYPEKTRPKTIHRKTAMRLADEMANRGIFERVPYTKKVRRNGKIISVSKTKYRLTPWGLYLFQRKKSRRPNRRSSRK